LIKSRGDRGRDVRLIDIQGMCGMQQAEIYERLNDLFREIFSDDGIVLTPQTTANDIDGWDSFNHLSIIVAVETRFGVKMKTAELEKLANVGSLVSAIESKLPA